MTEIITLLALLAVQVFVLYHRIRTRQKKSQRENTLNIVLFCVSILLMAAGIYRPDFRWAGLFLLLVLQAALSIRSILWPRPGKNAFRLKSILLSFAGSTLLIVLLMMPALLFPRNSPVMPTGPLATTTISVTLTDPARVDPFSTSGEQRKLTVQFWYPDTGEIGEYPLILFSHGAFGYRGSNRSTCMDLASHGYVVASIDHSHHAFFAQHTDSTTTPVDTTFLMDAIRVTGGEYDAQTVYDLTHQWLSVRTGDINFVLDEILKSSGTVIPESLSRRIQPDKIGLMGHSLGGAAAAQLGRDRSDIDGVTVLDGTMLGEEISFVNSRAQLNPQPYPVPLLNLYNEDHYRDAIRRGTAYSNLSASALAETSFDLVIPGSGHLNFTDLPLFSPVLASLLGTGSVDSRDCIVTMNRIVLEFFDRSLKGLPVPQSALLSQEQSSDTRFRSEKHGVLAVRPAYVQ